MEHKKGSQIHPNAKIVGPESVSIRGKAIIDSGAVLRGDLARISLGQFCAVGQESILRPCCKQIKGKSVRIPMSVGDYVSIDRNCVIEAASIGSNVIIGKRCVIGQRCVLMDGCQILDGSILADNTVVPSYTIFSGVPARSTGRLAETFCYVTAQRSRAVYHQPA